MHELSLAESVIDLVEASRREHAFVRVHVVRLAVGALAAVEPEALDFAFASVASGTCAQGARLEIVEVPGQGECSRCGIRGPMEELVAVCAACGGPMAVVAGRDLRVLDLDVE